MAPLVGIAIVPVTLPVGAGLTPNDVISVASSGTPTAPTDPPGLIPRGEVVPSEGMAVSGSSGSSTWANAGLAHNKHQAAKSGRTAAITDNVGGISFGSPRRRGEESIDDPQVQLETIFLAVARWDRTANGVIPKLLVSSSSPSAMIIAKPTGNTRAPTNGTRVCAVTSNARLAPKPSNAPDRLPRMRRSRIVCGALAALMSISFSTISLGARLSDIGQSLISSVSMLAR
jgi:hypothetical protein